MLSAALMPPRSGQYGRTQPTSARFSSIHRMLETPSVTLTACPFKSLLHLSGTKKSSAKAEPFFVAEKQGFVLGGTDSASVRAVRSDPADLCLLFKHPPDA